MDHLHACLLDRSWLGLLLAWFVLSLLQFGQQALAVEPEPANLALNATSESFPLMSSLGLLAQEICEDFSFLLNERDLVLNLFLLAVDEVRFVLDQDTHPLPGTEQDGMGIIIDM